EARGARRRRRSDGPRVGAGTAAAARDGIGGGALAPRRAARRESARPDAARPGYPAQLTMRAIPFAIVLALALASAGCPDSLERRCPSNSLPSGSFHLTLTLQPTPHESLQLRQPDGGPPPADGSIVPASQPVESILCAGTAAAAG